MFMQQCRWPNAKNPTAHVQLAKIAPVLVEESVHFVANFGVMI